MTDIQNEVRQPMTEHLEELRRKIFISLASVVACSLIGYLFSEQILQFMSASVVQKGVRLYFFAPTEAFMARVKVSIVVGITLASPFLFKQVWDFIAPGLRRNERSFILPWTFASTALFCIGILFGFFLVLPVALDFLLGYRTSFIEPMLSVSLYISFAAALTVAFGIAFNLPILIVGSVTGGWVKLETYRKFRRHAYVGTFVASMILTPPDVYSQVLLAVPMIGLYEISLIVSAMLKKRASGQ